MALEAGGTTSVSCPLCHSVAPALMAKGWRQVATGAARSATRTGPPRGLPRWLPTRSIARSWLGRRRIRPTVNRFPGGKLQA